LNRSRGSSAVPWARRRGTLKRLIAGTAIVAAVGVVMPEVAIAAPAGAVAIAAQSTDIEKAKAAAELGIVAGPELLVLTDRNFVAAMYYAADDLDKPRPLEPEHQKLKEAAIAALAASGEDASSQFIKVGIFAAHQEDQRIVTERRQRQEEERTAKSKAAAAISVPVDNTILAKTVYDFIVYLDLKADSHKDMAVKQAARTVLLGTAEQQWNFLVVGIHDEHRADVDRLIREDTAKTEAEKLAELARQAKANAAWHALGLSSDQAQALINLSDQDFCIEIWNRAARDTEVYGAAEEAVRSRDPVLWKRFIDTGAKDAHLRDIEIMLDKRDKEVIRQITELRTRAVNSLVHPDLVAAADTALAAGPIDREKFLRVGQYERQIQSLRIEMQTGVEHYLADSNGDVAAAPWTPGDHPEMRWKVEPGLSNPECFSFQSVTRPNNYLRWRSGWTSSTSERAVPPNPRVYVNVDPTDGTAAFKADATWCVRGDANAIALRPVRDVEDRYLFISGAIDDEWDNLAPKLHAEAPKPLLPMDRRYAAEPALRTNLGAPAGDAVLDANNLGYKPYEKGRLYLNADDFGTYKRTAVHAVYNGPVLDKLLALGGPKALGGAMVDQGPTRDGRGQVLRFERTSGQHQYIMWSQATGARHFYGLIGLAWNESGGEIGPYGYPVTDELAYGTAGVRYTRFATGTIYWVPSQGAIRQVKGEIHKKFTAMGFEVGLGHAVGDETPFGTEGGRLQRFSTGSVYITPRNGTVALNGEIHQKYAAYNYEIGSLGYPISDVLTTSDGVGKYVNFSANSGVIYWHSSTGAHVMAGLITQKWRLYGAERSWLGYPTADEGRVAGVQRTVFQNGRIDSSNDGGATVAYQTTTVTPRAIEIKGVHSGRCIQVAGVGQGALNDGANTELWDCLEGVKQIWDVVSLGNNKYNLKNRNSGKCMDLTGGSLANSVVIIQNACGTSQAQQWEFTTTPGDNMLALRNVASAKVVEARAGGTPNATVISQMTDGAHAWQRWTIVPIG
jgi:hypothetical protein